MPPKGPAKISPNRKIEFTFTDPLFSYQSNTTVWHSLHNLTGKFDDYLGVDLGLDKHGIYRAGSLIYSALATAILGHYSHEFAHQQPEINYGAAGDFFFDGDDRGFGIFPRPTFHWKRQFCISKEIDSLSGTTGCGYKSVTFLLCRAG